jgi:small conductance mechanosensitive channel
MDQLMELLDTQQLLTMTVSFVPRLVAAIAVFAFFWLVQRLTSPPLQAMMRRARIDAALVHILIGNLYRFAVLIFGLVMAVGQIGIDVTAALAGISVAGLALGFAAQDSLANMIAGLLIFWDKPFSVGDFLTVGTQYGRVVEITMRSTRIRTQENTFVILPNKHIIDSVVVNHTKHGEVRVNVPIGIAYKERIPDARRVLLEAIRSLDGVMASPAPDVVVAELGGSSVNLLVRVWVDRPELERPVFFRALEASKLALDAAGIQIPYPHLQLFVDDVERRVFDKAADFLHLPGGRREPAGVPRSGGSPQ